MKHFYLLFVMIAAVSTSAADHQMHDMDSHNHEGHLHDTMVNGKLLEVNPERFDNFVSGLEGKQIAIVSVSGMVCDFCARGIEKTFSKDNTVLKLDVDLSGGKVLIAFDKDKNISFEDIKKKILSNGQNATDLQIIKI
jgi:tRNA-binding EMAP/Myf-like protein